jgi:hypothetical protein
MSGACACSVPVRCSRRATHGVTENWSVRARSALLVDDNPNHSVIDWAYPWSHCHTYATKPKPPEEPPTPEVVEGVWLGDWGVMLCFFKPSPGADHDLIEVEEVDPFDLTLSVGPLQSFDFILADVLAFTTQFKQWLGFDIPWLVTGVEGTVPLHAYRWRVRACNGNTCSPWSIWSFWSEIFPVPY